MRTATAVPTSWSATNAARSCFCRKPPRRNEGQAATRRRDRGRVARKCDRLDAGRNLSGGDDGGPHAGRSGKENDAAAGFSRNGFRGRTRGASTDRVYDRRARTAVGGRELCVSRLV